MRAESTRRCLAIAAGLAGELGPEDRIALRIALIAHLTPADGRRIAELAHGDADRLTHRAQRAYRLHEVGKASIRVNVDVARSALHRALDLVDGLPHADTPRGQRQIAAVLGDLARVDPDAAIASAELRVRAVDPTDADRASATLAAFARQRPNPVLDAVATRALDALLTLLPRATPSAAHRRLPDAAWATRDDPVRAARVAEATRRLAPAAGTVVAVANDLHRVCPDLADAMVREVAESNDDRARGSVMEYHLRRLGAAVLNDGLEAIDPVELLDLNRHQPAPHRIYYGLRIARLLAPVGLAEPVVRQLRPDVVDAPIEQRGFLMAAMATLGAIDPPRLGAAVDATADALADRPTPARLSKLVQLADAVEALDRDRGRSIRDRAFELFDAMHGAGGPAARPTHPAHPVHRLCDAAKRAFDAREPAVRLLARARHLAAELPPNPRHVAMHLVARTWLKISGRDPGAAADAAARASSR